MKNLVRITSGRFKGRKIATPGGETHPMGERERLALFNMISEHLPGAMVLDVFAGSGALGIEALSRGAGKVVFVDSSQKATRCIRGNLLSLDIAIENNQRVNQMQPGENARVSSQDRYSKIGTVTRENIAYFASSEPNSESSAVSVICSKMQDFTAKQLFDLILADPPYTDYQVSEIETLPKILANGGILILSHPDEPPTLTGLNLIKSRKYAGATISIYEKGSST